MKRTVLTGILALAAGVGALTAQSAQPAPAGQAAPAAQTGQAAPATPRTKSPEEAAALKALGAAQQAGDADGIVKAAEDLLTRFADTQFKVQALTLEALAYNMKSDAVNEQVTWGRVIAADPNNIVANMKLGGIIARQVKDRDLDRDAQLAKAQQCVNTALDGLKAATSPQVAPLVAEAHYDLYLIAFTRATANKTAGPEKYDPAIAELQIASTTDPQQMSYQARLAYILQTAGKNAESVALCDKILANADLNAAIKSYVTTVRAAAVKAAPPAAK
jgi:hypothetical protein